MKTYRESRIELRNLQILSQGSFLPSELPCELKSLDVASDIAGVERIRSENLRLWSTLKAIRFQFRINGAFVTIEICVLYGWCFLKQSDIVSEKPDSCDTVGREL